MPTVVEGRFRFVVNTGSAVSNRANPHVHV